ncbi:hypothetical protein AB1Y20_001984 [Prymnesium parvum]|uniref:Trichome birefringence-like C-terminal domain-containing protein n=1 Tax=Prymnesium parvum TaxID=97485 RepID=A0AB34J7T3_PRYPA
MRPHPTGCVYEWRFNRSALTIDPSAFAALLAGGGLNSSKNEYRVKACLEKERESAHDSQRWELHFRTANGRAERILSLAHPAVAARLLSCQANATLSFVGDSYLLQLFASLARALIEWTRRADGSFRWRNSRRASADMEAAVHDDVPTLHVLPHNLTLRFHRSNQFQTLSSVDPLHAAVGKRMRAEQLAVVPSQSFLRAIRPPCAHRYVVQTGAWFAITRFWPPWMKYIDMVNATTRRLRQHCPHSRVTWLPPTQQHGGVQAALHLPTCVHTKQLINRSVFEAALRATQSSRLFGGGKNANTNIAHRKQLLDFEGGSLDVLDTSLIGQARADSHYDVKDNCGHWCLPGVPDVFGGALVRHLCEDDLPNPRSCTAL